MTAPDLFSCDVAVVKAELLRSFSMLMDPVFEAAQSGLLTPREAERRTWTVMVPLGAMLLTALFATLCRRETQRAVAALGLDMADVRLRMDVDYWAKLKSTFGALSFPWYAFRRMKTTHVPARELFPLHPDVRSTELLLEWESSLASDHPFRKAQEALLFFSHGAADVEDTTIERHAVLVGQTVPPEWLYVSVAKM